MLRCFKTIHFESPTCKIKIVHLSRNDRAAASAVVKRLRLANTHTFHLSPFRSVIVPPGLRHCDAAPPFLSFIFKIIICLEKACTRRNTKHGFCADISRKLKDMQDVFLIFGKKCLFLFCFILKNMSVALCRL